MDSISSNPANGLTGQLKQGRRLRPMKLFLINLSFFLLIMMPSLLLASSSNYSPFFPYGYNNNNYNNYGSNYRSAGDNNGYATNMVNQQQTYNNNMKQFQQPTTAQYNYNYPQLFYSQNAAQKVAPSYTTQQQQSYNTESNAVNGGYGTYNGKDYAASVSNYGYGPLPNLPKLQQKPQQQQQMQASSKYGISPSSATGTSHGTSNKKLGTSQQSATNSNGFVNNDNKNFGYMGDQSVDTDTSSSTSPIGMTSDGGYILNQDFSAGADDASPPIVPSNGYFGGVPMNMIDLDQITSKVNEAGVVEERPPMGSGMTSKGGNSFGANNYGSFRGSSMNNGYGMYGSSVQQELPYTSDDVGFGESAFSQQQASIDGKQKFGASGASTGGRAKSCAGQNCFMLPESSSLSPDLRHFGGGVGMGNNEMMNGNDGGGGGGYGSMMLESSSYGKGYNKNDLTNFMNEFAAPDYNGQGLDAGGGSGYGVGTQGGYGTSAAEYGGGGQHQNYATNAGFGGYGGGYGGGGYMENGGANYNSGQQSFGGGEMRTGGGSDGFEYGGNQQELDKNNAYKNENYGGSQMMGTLESGSQYGRATSGDNGDGLMMPSASSSPYDNSNVNGMSGGGALDSGNGYGGYGLKSGGYDRMFQGGQQMMGGNQQMSTENDNYGSYMNSMAGGENFGGRAGNLLGYGFGSSNGNVNAAGMYGGVSGTGGTNGYGSSNGFGGYGVDNAGTFMGAGSSMMSPSTGSSSMGMENSGGGSNFGAMNGNEMMKGNNGAFYGMGKMYGGTNNGLDEDEEDDNNYMTVPVNGYNNVGSMNNNNPMSGGYMNGGYMPNNNINAINNNDYYNNFRSGGEVKPNSNTGGGQQAAQQGSGGSAASAPNTGKFKGKNGDRNIQEYLEYLNMISKKYGIGLPKPPKQKSDETDKGYQTGTNDNNNIGSSNVEYANNGQPLNGNNNNQQTYPNRFGGTVTNYAGVNGGGIYGNYGNLNGPPNALGLRGNAAKTSAGNNEKPLESKKSSDSNTCTTTDTSSSNEPCGGGRRENDDTKEASLESMGKKHTSPYLVGGNRYGSSFQGGAGGGEEENARQQMMAAGGGERSLYTGGEPLYGLSPAAENGNKISGGLKNGWAGGNEYGSLIRNGGGGNSEFQNEYEMWGARNEMQTTTRPVIQVFAVGEGQQQHNSMTQSTTPVTTTTAQPPLAQTSTTSVQALTQQIRRLPAVLYLDSTSQDARRLETLLRDTYGLPLVSFYIDKIDKPELVEKNLQQLTAHKGSGPFLFVCGTFIGTQEHIENYHKNKQIPQLVEYVCGNKDKFDAVPIIEGGDKVKDSGRKTTRRKKKKQRSPTTAIVSSYVVSSAH